MVTLQSQYCCKICKIW